MKTRAKWVMMVAGAVAAPLAGAVVLIVGIPLFRYMGPKPSVPALQAQGQKLVNAVQRYRANQGDYPTSLEDAGVSAPCRRSTVPAGGPGGPAGAAPAATTSAPRPTAAPGAESASQKSPVQPSESKIA